MTSMGRFVAAPSLLFAELCGQPGGGEDSVGWCSSVMGPVTRAPLRSFVNAHGARLDLRLVLQQIRGDKLGR